MRIKLKYKTVVIIAVSCVVLASLLFYFTFFGGNNNSRQTYAEDTPEQNMAEENIPGEDGGAQGKPSMPTETPLLSEADDTVYVNSKLTNLPVPESVAMSRPVAVVINNHYSALPQSGIAGADIIYEVLAEGEITRLVGIFQNYNLPKIGPVRSARDYFVDFALDYGAVFIHHGGSPTGYAKIRGEGIDSLDGMTYEGRYFWRDRTYPSWHTKAGNTRSAEHSSYTGGEQIKTAMAEQDFRAYLYEDGDFGFHFFPDKMPANLARGEANTITVPFSRPYTRRFIYNPELSQYEVYNRDGSHADADEGEALTIRNVIIQMVESRVIAGDEAGRRTVGTVGSGNGYLAADGVYRPVTWRKHSPETPTEWYAADGSEMELGTGKTWICVTNTEVSFE